VKADVGVEGRTQETYLAYSRSTNLKGSGKLTPNKTVAFGLNPAQFDDTYSLGGQWKVGTQSVTSTEGSQARVSYNASKVYHVLSGQGAVTVSIAGEPDKTVTVSGTPNAYQLVDQQTAERKTMTLTYSPGIRLHFQLRLSRLRRREPNTRQTSGLLSRPLVWLVLP